MSADSEFPYPGDDPAELVSVWAAFSNAQGRADSAVASLDRAASSMKANWESAAATAAGADLARFRTTLRQTSTHLRNAANAVDAYRGALIKIRSEVDDLRRQLTSQESALFGQTTAYARAGRFGEINGMTPAQVTSYRNGIAGDEAATKGHIRHLTSDYDALVRRANTATQTCREALSASIHAQQYSGASVVSVNLNTALGLNQLVLLAAAEPINVPHGAYHYDYRFSLHQPYSPGSAAAIMAAITANFSSYFPIDAKGHPHTLTVGEVLKLRPFAIGIGGHNAYQQTAPVRVISITPTSFAFVSLPGHPEGAGKIIQFSIVNDHGQLALRTQAGGHKNLIQNVPGELQTGNTLVAKPYWSDFALAIRKKYFGYQPPPPYVAPYNPHLR